MLATLPQMTELSLADLRVLIRLDLNVPMQAGVITHNARILRALPTIALAIEQGARVMIASHWGRPTEGHYEPDYSLAPVARALSELLGMNVPLVTDYLSTPPQPDCGQVVLLENVRFNPGEKASDPVLSRQLGALCDVFVMDAFACAHRAHASTVGVLDYAPMVCAGPLMVEELSFLARALAAPERPLVAIVGGAKVSTKFGVLEHLVEKVDFLIPGGGIANTFLKSQGIDVARSLYEPDWVAKAEQLLTRSRARGGVIVLPDDVVVAPSMDQGDAAQTVAVDAVPSDQAIFDIGTQTAERYASVVAQAKTVVWNGPVGVFERAAFAAGTERVAHAVATSNALTIAGGGDTLAALAQFDLTDTLSYVSTAGGAFLDYLQGDTLPAIASLQSKHLAEQKE